MRLSAAKVRGLWGTQSSEKKLLDTIRGPPSRLSKHICHISEPAVRFSEDLEGDRRPPGRLLADLEGDVGPPVRLSMDLKGLRGPLVRIFSVVTDVREPRLRFSVELEVVLTSCQVAGCGMWDVSAPFPGRIERVHIPYGPGFAQIMVPCVHLLVIHSLAQFS